MNAPLILPQLITTRFGYPFKNKQDQAITDPQTFYDGLAFVQSGHYPLGVHGFFHGGVHIARASNNALSLKDEAIGCMADGEVVAYRIDRRYSDATPGASGEGTAQRPYSVGFVLVRHRVQAPTPPQPPKPAPVENPMADRRNMGTYLYADERGNNQLAWLPQGTPLLVEVGPDLPGKGSYVQVLDVMSPGLPKQGWINRVWLALDPLAGAGLRGVFGMKERVQTSVYSGDQPDPNKMAAYYRNEDELAKPAAVPAPTLTLYSLYMHLSDLASYEKHAKRPRPTWWPATDDKAPRLPEATDRVVVLKQPVPIREGDLIGYIGEDVPARTGLLANKPASQPLLHLEMFSGDDVPAYLAASRKWAMQHLPDSERTLLVLRKGDTLHAEPNGTVTLGRPQIVPLAGMEVREVEGKRWRKVVKLSEDKGGPATGWVQEEGKLASPWEWPGFEVHDEASTAGGFRHDDAPAFATYIRQEGSRPPDSPFFGKLRNWLDSNHDGDVSEEELDWALRNRSVAGMLGRLIVRHESEWSRTYSAAHQATSLCIAEQLGPNTVRCIQEETPRAEKLPWWDEVAAGVAGFPQNSRVYHFHPGGVAGLFKGAAKCEKLTKQGDEIEAHNCMVDLPDDLTAAKPLYTPEQRASHYAWRKGMAECKKIEGFLEQQYCYQDVPADWTALDPDEMNGVSINGIDHLAEHLSVQDFYVNGASGAQAGKAGRNLCCVKLPNRWRPGLTVEVQWNVTNWRDCTGNDYARRVPVERYDHAANLFIHFLADGNVRAVSSEQFPGNPGHPNPKYPVHDPIPDKYPWHKYPLDETCKNKEAVMKAREEAP